MISRGQKKRKMKLEADVTLCEKLVRAKDLIDGLGGEKSRWKQSIVDLKEEFKNLTGNVMISSGVIAYLGAFTSIYRRDCIASWVDLCKKLSIPCANTIFETNTWGSSRNPKLERGRAAHRRLFYRQRHRAL